MTAAAPLAGRVALVTGSSRGIGRAIAVTLASKGADVLVNYRRRPEEAGRTVAAIERLGRRAVAVQANMARPGDISNMFAVLERELGGLDFLVCNAGGGMQSTLLDATPKAWDLAMNVNARGYLLCAQAAFPLMKRRGGGRILALTAVEGIERVFPSYGTVAASKAAANALTVYLAAELGPHGIAVNAVSPGFVDTEALGHYDYGQEALGKARRLTPSGRVTTPEDAAALVAFLCQDDAGQVSGQIIQVDGGFCRVLP